MDNKYKPQENWQKKAGLVSKSYKLRRDVIDNFAQACEHENVSQAGKLTELMENFISEIDKKLRR